MMIFMRERFFDYLFLLLLLFGMRSYYNERQSVCWKTYVCAPNISNLAGLLKIVLMYEKKTECPQ